MAKVKIFLGKDETIEEVESDLNKAFNFHASGEVHDEQMFNDPAMNHAVQRMDEVQRKIFEEMLREIFDEIDKDYLK